MGVALVRVDFGNAESKEGEGEELERIFGSSTVRNRREQIVLRAGLLVGFGVESANSTLD